MGLAEGCREVGFECGQPLPNDSAKFRRCDRSQEVCICATGGCAKPLVTLDEIDWGKQHDCGSKLLYVDDLFGGPLAGQCVDGAHARADLVLSNAEAGHACPNVVITPKPDASAEPDASPEPTPEAGPPEPNPPAPPDAGDELDAATDATSDAAGTP